MSKFIIGNHYAIKSKSIDNNSVLTWDYRVEKIDGVIVEIASYFNSLNDINPVAQKVIYPDGKVKIIGDINKASLYGQWLFNGGKKLIVTQNELDAISLSQINDHKYPVVAVKDVASAKDNLKKQLEWVESFEEVVFLFQNDDASRKAAEDCAGLLTPGKAKIASVPLSSVNEMLKADKKNEVINAIFKAKTHRLDGIVNSRDTLELVKVKPEKGMELINAPRLSKMVNGIKTKQLITICAGSGLGKSAFVREVAYEIAVTKGETVGYVALEESVGRSAEGFIGINLNHPIHLNRDGITDEKIEKAWEETLGKGNVYFYDHFGSLDSENLISKIRYLAKGCNCKYIFLDHISIAVSGLGDGDERRIIDNLMTKLRSLVEETGICLFIISHLTRPKNGNSHEEGGQTSLSQLRGSHAIAQLSDIVIGMERDQQNAELANYSKLRVLKNRPTGQTGVADTLHYNPVTGRLLKHDCTYAEDFKED